MKGRENDSTYLFQLIVDNYVNLICPSIGTYVQNYFGPSKLFWSFGLVQIRLFS